MRSNSFGQTNTCKIKIICNMWGTEAARILSSLIFDCVLVDQHRRLFLVIFAWVMQIFVRVEVAFVHPKGLRKP